MYSTEIGNQVAALRDQFVKATAIEKPTAEDVETAKKMHDDLAVLETKYKEVRDIEAAGEATKGAIEAEAAAKVNAEKAVGLVPFGGRLGTDTKANGATPNVFDGFIQSSVYKSMTKAGHHHGVSYSVEVPGLIKAAGDPIMSSQFTPIVTDPSAPPLHYAPAPSVYDLFRVVPITGAASVRFFLATMPVAVNGVNWVAEGAAKPEVQLRWTPKDAPLEVVAEWTAVTLQALDDVPQLRAVLFDDLRNLLMWKINDGLLNGNGTPPQILGITSTPGVQAQAFATDPITTILAAITKVVATGAGYPTGIVMNPADWAAVRSTVSAGVWVFGSPTESGTMRLFGVPVVTTSAQPVGFAIVGDFSFGTIFERWGVTFIVGLKNDDLIKNIQTIVCEARLALAIRRPSAFVNADLTAL